MTLTCTKHIIPTSKKTLWYEQKALHDTVSLSRIYAVHYISPALHASRNNTHFPIFITLFFYTTRFKHFILHSKSTNTKLTVHKRPNIPSSTMCQRTMDKWSCGCKQIKTKSCFPRSCTGVVQVLNEHKVGCSKCQLKSFRWNMDALLANKDCEKDEEVSPMQKVFK